MKSGNLIYYINIKYDLFDYHLCDIVFKILLYVMSEHCSRNIVLLIWLLRSKLTWQCNYLMPIVKLVMGTYNICIGLNKDVSSKVKLRHDDYLFSIERVSDVAD